jgi:hypothetical protein
MAKSPSLSNLTALRDETVLRRVRHFGSARNGLREVVITGSVWIIANLNTNMPMPQ